jgi:methyl-accepting chemotaxis protein
MSIRHLSVRNRLGLGFGILLLLLLAVVATSLVQLAGFNRNVEALANTRLVQLITVSQASNALAEITRGTGNILVLDGEGAGKEELSLLRAHQGEVQELLLKVAKNGRSGREDELLKEITGAQDAYMPLADRFLQMAERGDYSSAKDLMLNALLPAQHRMVEAIGRFEDHQVALSADEARKTGDAYQWTFGVLVALAAVAVAAGVLLSWMTTRAITRPIGEAVAIAQRVAAGDLTVEVRSGGSDEMGQLLRALAGMTHNLRQLAGEVTAGARMVADTSAQIAQGNQDLSQRTEEQASTLEETSSAMEELTSTVTQNAENARHATQLASGASDVARKGGQVVGDVVNTMSEITGAARRISEIIGVIDSIAFQTNILALNAAVEAARAGDQGRGFAVVASEVRNLAQRSAGAAKEIKSLIGESVTKVDAGARLVGTAGQTMEEIVASVKQVSDLIAEIAAASQEQSAGIEQVHRAVSQMDQVVQQNASLVEEAAAATESMKGQAAALLHTVSRFRLDNEAGQSQDAQASPVKPEVIPPIRFRPAALPAAIGAPA